MPDESVLNKAIDLGTTYFKTEEFRKAKSLFEKAVQLVESYSKEELVRVRGEYLVDELPDELYATFKCNKVVCHPKHVKVLDNLSACWEKLAIMDNALRVAHRMVKLEPFNIRTYVRKGRILLRLNKYRECYMNYREGIKRVQYAHDHYGVPYNKKMFQYCEQQKRIVKGLTIDKAPEVEKRQDNPKRRVLIDPIAEQSQLKKKKVVDLQESVHTSESRDFLAVFPAEINARIFRTIPSKQLCQMTLVSHEWREYLLATSSLFSTFLFHNLTLRQMNRFCEFVEKLYKIKAVIDIKGPIHIKALKISCKTPTEEIKTLEIFFKRISPIITCEKLILTTPNSTTSQLAKLVPKTGTFTKGIKELSLMCILRADRQYELEILSPLTSLKRLEILFNNSVIPLSKMNDIDGLNIQLSKYDFGWTDNLQYLSLICDNHKVPKFPFHEVLRSKQFHSLKKLCISGVKMIPLGDQFDWLINFPHLNELWLEHNVNALLQHFLNTVRDIRLWDNLERLTFREDRTNEKFSLENVNRNFFYSHNLHNLKVLDLMGSSITGLGMTRLLQYLSPVGLRKLNLGDCIHVQFSKFAPRPNNESFLETAAVLAQLDSLEDLVIPKLSSLDDDAVNLISQYAHLLQSLERIDIALNHQVTGVSLYTLLKNLYTFRERPLKALNIDGCNEVSHITVNMIKAQGLVDEISCIYDRDVWNQFGTNSYRYIG
ncbi:Protein DIA2 [Nakaseomyces bracarensis]|uniref:Protein DIA2 n=1 Tax=Nakaseomyces bracarensis TaxID=273131 RepID=A0ABR4NZH5_9SACH